MADWIGGNFYLTREQMEMNATYCYGWLNANGWSLNAISGMFGNMQTESGINPGIWEDLNEGNLNGGFGLTQWTPASKYLDWANERGLDYTQMDSNLMRIEWEVAEHEQWISTSAYPMSFEEFKTSEAAPYTLGMTFLYNYERPTDLNQPFRGTQAQEWYKYLSGVDPPDPPGQLHKMPFYFYLKRRYI